MTRRVKIKSINQPALCAAQEIARLLMAIPLAQNLHTMTEPSKKAIIATDDTICTLPPVLEGQV